MTTYNTLTEAINGLREQGFTLDFNLAFDHVKCNMTDVCLYPGGFEITEVHRFEGETDPADQTILYGIEAKDGSAKGVLVSAYGVYSEDMDDELLRKLTIHH